MRADGTEPARAVTPLPRLLALTLAPAPRSRSHCPVTCGVCKGVCKDVHDDCPGWAKEGECANNPGHTMKTCPFSCGIETCKAPGGCADKNATACAIWALDDECVKNP